MNHDAIFHAIINQLQNSPDKYVNIKTCKYVEPNISWREIDLYIKKLEENGYVSNIQEYGDGFLAELTIKGGDVRNDYFPFSLEPESKSKSMTLSVNQTIIKGDGNVVMTNQSSDKNDLKQSPKVKQDKHSTTMRNIGIATVVLALIAIIVAIMTS